MNYTWRQLSYTDIGRFIVGLPGSVQQLYPVCGCSWLFAYRFLIPSTWTSKRAQNNGPISQYRVHYFGHLGGPGSPTNIQSLSDGSLAASTSLAGGSLADLPPDPNTRSDEMMRSCRDSDSGTVSNGLAAPGA